MDVSHTDGSGESPALRRLGQFVRERQRAWHSGICDASRRQETIVVSFAHGANSLWAARGSARPAAQIHAATFLEYASTSNGCFTGGWMGEWLPEVESEAADRMGGLLTGY